jgi:hypothetical protein
MTVDTIMQTWADRGHAGLADMQTEQQQVEATIGLYLCYQPTLIPGLLQTPEYAHRVFSIMDVEGGDEYTAAVSQRIRRQDVLHNSRRRFEFVLTEAALRARIVPDDLLRLQHAHLKRVASLSNVTITVIPYTADQQGDGVALGWCGFDIFDERGDLETFVSIELPHAGLTLHNPEQVDYYRAQFQQHKQHAVELASVLHD